jgi:BirA family transcriptional regulator, biotin operon repressor / biotin---[acetyl-CoA-carboxylase] ligase
MAFALGSQAQSAGYRLVSFDSIGSTNAEGLARARAGEQGPLWLVTDQQTSGRGRRNREWISPRGNLAASVLEVIETQPAVAATLGFAAGVALAGTLRSFFVEAELKWPNDVLLRGAKLSGILLEAENLAEGRMAVVTGIGVNVVGAPQDVPYAATSLADAGFALSARQVFARLSDHWADARRVWDHGQGMGELRSKWLSFAAGVGGPVTVQLGGRTVSGVFETIDDGGHLIVVTADGQRVPIASGEVFFGDASASPAGAA